MATTKTLTPTNQAITLAAFTEKPDNRTNVTNDDKLADAVNALNSNIPLFRYGIEQITFDPNESQTKTVTFNVPMNDSNYMVSLTQEDSAGVYVDIVFGVTNRTTTGFTIRSASKRSSIIKVNIGWMAIEHV